jgi:aminopeptidase-like protein
MRSKYGAFPEYHTSLDNLEFVTAKGLAGGFAMLKLCLEIIEGNHIYRAVMPCEPQLGKRGLYPTLSQVSSTKHIRTMMNLLAYADGEHDLVQLGNRIGADALTCAGIAQRLLEEGLLERC